MHCTCDLSNKNIVTRLSYKQLKLNRFGGFMELSFALL